MKVRLFEVELDDLCCVFFWVGLLEDVEKVNELHKF